LKVECSE